MNSKIKSRLWLEKDGEMFLGWGRIQLLIALQKHGSISLAAKSLQMSYRKAWSLINASNEISEFPLVNKTIGGKNGGGATLTVYGEKVINNFEILNTKCEKFLEKEVNKLDWE